MDYIKKKLLEKGEVERAVVKRLINEFGHVVIEDVNIDQVLTGMKGITGLLTVTSKLDPESGIRYRGHTIPELQEKLPKLRPEGEPLPEGLFYLMLLDEMPTRADVDSLSKEWYNRSHVPEHVFRVLDSMPLTSKPMTQFSTAILSMATESKFQKAYRDGLHKNDYWDTTYEDVMNLIARLPVVAAYIYRRNFADGKFIPPDPNLDWAANFAHMMGIGKPYDDVSRMHFIIHADHEGGNVSAHTGHLVSSSLSDIYLSIAAMVNGLAGPLHGLANQEVLRWLQGVMEKMEDRIPTEEEMKLFVWDTLKSGQVIPGYGHAVLRKTDPRYTLQRNFSLTHLKDDLMFKYTDMLYKVVPDILREQGKAKNPWPNVDAQSGVIQWHYGVKEYDYYTVLFGIGRAIGIAANIIWDRALGYPLERPKSITTAMLEDFAAGKEVIIED